MFNRNHKFKTRQELLLQSCEIMMGSDTSSIGDSQQAQLRFSFHQLIISNTKIITYSAFMLYLTETFLPKVLSHSVTSINLRSSRHPGMYFVINLFVMNFTNVSYDIFEIKKCKCSAVNTILIAFILLLILAQIVSQMVPKAIQALHTKKYQETRKEILKSLCD